MWREVTMGDESLLQTALEVLRERNPRWTSVDRLRSWLLSRPAKLFYYQDPSFELVLGFRFDREAREWRVGTAGGRGLLGDSAGRQMAQQLVTFAQSQSVRDIGWQANESQPSSPDRILAEGVISFALALPEVAEVRERAESGGVRYDLILR